MWINDLAAPSWYGSTYTVDEIDIMMLIYTTVFAPQKNQSINNDQ